MAHAEFPNVDDGICTFRRAFPAASRIRAIGPRGYVSRKRLDTLDEPVEESIADDNRIEIDLDDEETSDDQ